MEFCLMFLIARIASVCFADDCPFGTATAGDVFGIEATWCGVSSFQLRRLHENQIAVAASVPIWQVLLTLQRWVQIFLVSMDDRLLDTKLHFRFAIFLYTYRLETAMLTKRVELDAADAERSVESQHVWRLGLLRVLLHRATR